MEGTESAAYFSSSHREADEIVDGVFAQPWQSGQGDNAGESKHRHLTEELIYFKGY